MNEKLGQEPAFATQHTIADANDHCFKLGSKGMSKREYAAIELRVPDSGEEWLNEMIRKANRRDAANSAMQGILANQNGFTIDSDGSNSRYVNYLISDSFRFADELFKTIEK